VAHVEIVCATHGCGQFICTTSEHEERLRRTHEVFYCPAGHHNYFAAGKADQGPRSAAREPAAIAQSLWRHPRRDAGREAAARHARKVCPFECGYVARRKRTTGSIRIALQDHLSEQHGAVPLEVGDAVAS
jgi:hypothetical protein